MEEGGQTSPLGTPWWASDSVDVLNGDVKKLGSPPIEL